MSPDFRFFPAHHLLRNLFQPFHVCGPLALLRGLPVKSTDSHILLTNEIFPLWVALNGSFGPMLVSI